MDEFANNYFCNGKSSCLYKVEWLIIILFFFFKDQTTVFEEFPWGKCNLPEVGKNDGVFMQLFVYPVKGELLLIDDNTF